jgi:hypothetical protein
MKDSIELKKKQITNSIELLNCWIEKNGWEGYDPYDLKSIPYLVELERLERNATIPQKIIRKILFELRHNKPYFARKILRVKRRINAKGMGLFSSAYLMIYQELGDEALLKKALECAEWLKKNYNTEYPGMSWGYPFDWRSYVFIPEGTPSGVVTSVVGDAFWRLYNYTEDIEYLHICKKICYFFIKGLNIDCIDTEKICFSYTPLDRTHIHNANLFVADFLFKIGLEDENGKFINLAHKAVNYTINQINKNGSLFYRGRDQTDVKHIDNYHSGFEIRTLFSIYKLTQRGDVLKSFQRYLTYYLGIFFQNETIPKFTPISLYPINIHSCSESIICLSILARTFPICKPYLEKVYNWTLQNMRNRDGSFIYEIRYEKKLKRIKIPYIRWSQAWMMRALAEYLKYLNLERKTM